MNISSKRELRKIIRYEKKIYLPGPVSENLMLRFVQDERVLFFKYLRLLRKEEYLLGRRGLARKMHRFCTRRRNRLGNRINVKILPFYTGKGVNIHHKGVIINGRIGENCVFHGQNCIGNDGVHEDRIPSVGSGVHFGFGASAFGDITIADNVFVGAGAVAVKSIGQPGSVAVGIPAAVK